ncbi:RNA-dependent RNA polymerase 1-like [Silene latifolia]|uniref:RNA-dependent RNA polymerase 1-like n=1 Tax=Silene latifolia TaxID=37657 RepID=UPI003D784A80
MGKTIQVSGFPSTVSAEQVKTYLESHTGEGTVYALKVRPFKSGGVRVYVIVQFTAVKFARVIMSLCEPPKKLWFQSNYLKAREVDQDIVPRPRTNQHKIENITLHVGCQTANDEFVRFWEVPEVSLSFGHSLRKLYFELSSNSKEYKLELSYESIWQIELRRPRGCHSKYLLIQLFGAPRIFEKAERTFLQFFINNFFKDAQDDQWFRTTDFTALCCIGQSSVFCLELPYNSELPDFKDNFVYFKENEGPFTLKQGNTFSQNFELVPIVSPPRGIKLPFEILFKVNNLIQNGCLAGPNLNRSFYQMIDPCRIDKACIESALERLHHEKECCYNPVEWLKQEYTKYLSSRRRPARPTISLDEGLVYVRRVQVTPCRVYFCGPEVNVSNRVIRNFSNDINNFLRVSFVDENLEKLYSTDLSPRISSEFSVVRRTEIDGRIRSVLRNGIVIDDKKFEFLAFSSSQLRENSAWMFASRPGLSASDIRTWMGDFKDIRNVAKYAARLGQSFGSSTETLTVASHEVDQIPDVKIIHGLKSYVFSDGIGKISADFARKVATKCGFKSSMPSAFQIRYGGYKGVVAVDPTSLWKLSLRPSMCKYKSENNKLDVLAYSKYQPCYLNRQLITLLSTLGVQDRAFEKKQKEALEQLDAILTDPLKAQSALELMCPGEVTNILKEMLKCGYKPDAEPFLSMMLQSFREAKLQELRTKTRIFLPKGRALMGCLDETKSLEYGQVFVQVSGGRFRDVGNELIVNRGSEGEPNCVLQRKVVVAKNPCLHPGDVRVLTAVDVPALHHMVDCVVFPQKGMRPHPNECSGSDLDGDIYFVCWDSELIPTRQVEPMDYSAEKSEELDHDVTMEEVMEYFANYIINDSLGIISNAHTAFADRQVNKAMSSQCIELAKLFSIAVDFPKTGVPAVIPQNLYVKEFPDFMDKPDKPTYESTNVIGKLFREVKARSPQALPIREFTREMAKRSYDPDMEHDGFEDHVADAHYHKTQYDYRLGNLMDYYGIKTEAEILSGNIMKMSKSFDKRKDAEAVTLAVRSLRKEARSWFKERDDDSVLGENDVYAKASAWYYVTYHASYYGQYNNGMNRDHFLSFPWCVYDKLITIKKNKKLARKSRDVEALEQEFNKKFGLN